MEEVKPEMAEDEEEKAAVQKEGEIEKVAKEATVVIGEGGDCSGSGGNGGGGGEGRPLVVKGV